MYNPAGKLVWYYPYNTDWNYPGHRGDYTRVQAAIVQRIGFYGTVDLAVSTPDGTVIERTAVPLVQPGDDRPTIAHCAWEPW